MKGLKQAISAIKRIYNQWNIFADLNKLPFCNMYISTRSKD